jgi:hydrogenase nickel incorporation protein HypA/HybF
MHELSLAEALVAPVLALAAEHRARVVEVVVRAGALQMIVPESLATGFAVVAAGTAADGARLVVEPVPVTARCRRCTLEFAVEDQVWACPVCGVADVETLTGTELILARIELEPCESTSSTMS